MGKCRDRCRISRKGSHFRASDARGSPVSIWFFSPYRVTVNHRVTAFRRPFVLWFVLELPFIHTSHFSLAIPMSATNQTAGPSVDNFTAIFNAAIVEYQTLTGKPLDTHPFATLLNTCQNPEAVLNLLRTQAQAFSKFRKGDEKLMTWLDPTIHILSAFSDTLGEGISLVSNLVYLHMTGVGCPVFSHSHLQRRSLRGSAFFSEYVFFPQSLIAFYMISNC